MILMTFECPATGKPLRTLKTTWSSERADKLVALHCPKCSTMHRFTHEQALLGMTRERAPA